MISIEQLEEELLETDEYICLNPEIGRWLHKYVEHELSDTQRQNFEAHLLFCQKCQDDLAYVQGIVNALKRRSATANAVPRIPIARFADEIALEITWIPEGTGLPCVAAKNRQKKAFPLSNGHITIECQWDDDAILIEWHIDVRSDQEFWLRLFNPDTGKRYYETCLRTIRDGSATLLREEIGFTPTAQRWSVGIA